MNLSDLKYIYGGDKSPSATELAASVAGAPEERPREARCSVATGSKGEPATIDNCEKQKALDFAKTWMRKNYSHLHDSNRDAYYTKLGFLVDFITDFIEPSNTRQ